MVKSKLLTLETLPSEMYSCTLPCDHECDGVLPGKDEGEAPVFMTAMTEGTHAKLFVLTVLFNYYPQLHIVTLLRIAQSGALKVKNESI
jgi:hypothetical protein